MTVNDNLSLSLNPHLTCYISTGCNRTSNCLDWGYNNYICFGACNSVAVAEFSDGKCQILVTLSRHKGRINSVRWIRGCPKETELVTGSSDNTLILWRFIAGEIKPISIMTSHSLPVNIVDGLYTSEFTSDGAYPDTYIATASADSTVKLWLRKHSQDEFTCVNTINLGHGLCLSLSLARLVSESAGILLAIGTDDSKIHLYSDKTKLQTLVGHEDWVKSLHFTVKDDFLLLASGSQDCTIRLWKISRKTVEEERDNDSNEFKLAEQVFRLDSIDYIVTLESLLMGHESWVTGLQWKPNSGGKQLVSSSMDRTVLLWEVEEETGVWLEVLRLGELGGNTLGYLSVAFSPSNCQYLLANSHQGALHMWMLLEESSWQAVACFSGHCEGVIDVGWENKKGRYILSCSLDKTTRLHSPWSKSLNKEICWYEMSRPQIHGHAMAGLAPLPFFNLASISEEKVIRIFKAPDNILQNLINLSTSFSENERAEGVAPLGAAVPSLGLSNKAVFYGEEIEKSDKIHPNDEFSDGYFTPQFLTEPPTEDNLAQNTLWPETMKLYGHGYEVYSLAATYAGDLLATACKATSPLHAKILLWDTKSWVQVAELEGHNLTVTQMEFSPDDNKLISVSRDRTWCLFVRTDDKYGFKLLLKSRKEFNPHSRIIWCCSWSHEGLYFATGSRDCKVAVWPGESLHIVATRPPASQPLILQQSVTALAFARCNILCLPPLKYLLAVGLESGTIQAYLWEPTTWMLLFTVPAFMGHHLSVSRLCFRPALGWGDHPREDFDNTVQLASCSLDHSVRVFTINIAHFLSGFNQT